MRLVNARKPASGTAAHASVTHTMLCAPPTQPSCRGGTFNVYWTGPPDGAVVLCLHGAGYTGLTWSLVATKLKHKWAGREGKSGPG